MKCGWLWLWLGGCPWIPLAEHEENQKGLDAKPDADADTDSDSDTDTDADTDTDTPPGCADDPWEPNEIPGLNATRVQTLPASYEAVLCPENLDPATDLVLDVYRVDVGEEEVLEVALDGRGSTPCAALAMSVSVRDGGGTVYPDAELSGCGTVRVGWGPGTYYVWAAAPPGGSEQDYLLSLSAISCPDSDGDQFLAGECGGPDCADADASVWPGAPDLQDGIDQDCDGGDDLVPQDCLVASGFDFANGALPCGDLSSEPVWDAWTVPISAGGPLSVVVDNQAKGSADLLALIVDPDGTSHYGLDPDRTQLDDESACQWPAWTGGGCPAACVYAASAGAATIWVAQHPGAQCVSGATYRMLIYADGAAVTPSLVEDDAALVFPP